jgi:HEAT repeat protein
MPKALILAAIVCTAVVLALVVIVVTGPAPSVQVDSAPAVADEDVQVAAPETMPLGEDLSPRISRNPEAMAAGPSVAASFVESAAGLQPAAGGKAAVYAQIHEAMVTYSPEGVKALEPMLADAEPEIREAAINAIIQIGEKSGADALRRAARKTKLPRERMRMLEAADFIELPPIEFEPAQ